MTDHLLWSNDIENRFSPSSLTHVVDGSGYIATAIISSVTTNGSFRMSLWDAYKDLRQKLLAGDDALTCISTTTQRDALTGIVGGTIIFNETTQRNEIYSGTEWIAAGGETGSIVHLPGSTITTTDNTETNTHTITLDEGSAYLFTSEIIGKTSDLGTVSGFIIECTAKRVTAGSAEIVGNVTTTHSGKDSGAASWSVTFTVSGNDLSVSVTGGNATTVEWECDLNYLKY